MDSIARWPSTCSLVAPEAWVQLGITQLTVGQGRRDKMLHRSSILVSSWQGWSHDAREAGAVSAIAGEKASILGLELVLICHPAPRIHTVSSTTWLRLTSASLTSSRFCDTAKSTGTHRASHDGNDDNSVNMFAAAPFEEPYPGYAQENKGPLILTVTATLTGLCLLFVLSRLYSRMISTGKLAIDDFVVIVCIVCSPPILTRTETGGTDVLTPLSA